MSLDLSPRFLTHRLLSVASDENIWGMLDDRQMGSLYGFWVSLVPERHRWSQRKDRSPAEDPSLCISSIDLFLNCVLHSKTAVINNVSSYIVWDSQANTQV